MKGKGVSPKVLPVFRDEAARLQGLMDGVKIEKPTT